MQIYDDSLYRKKLLDENITSIVPIDKYKTSSTHLKHKCLICNGEWYATPNNIIHHRGCPYCAGKKVLIGFNDLWTTHPQTAKLLKDPKDGFIYTKGSNKKITFVCPYCKSEKKESPNKVNDYLICHNCSDGISYPEKFIKSALEQLQVNYIYQFNSTNEKWCKNYKYDFLINYKNKKIIIEVNGIQHYKKAFTYKNSRTLQEEMENDNKKAILALQNGINYYIQLDCRYSDYDYIVKSINDSLLHRLFDLSKINFKTCQDFALTSLVYEVCKSYSTHTVKELSEKYKISESCVYTYLRQGNKLNLCNFRGIENNKYATAKKVVCLNNLKIYNSISEASRLTGVSQNAISKACKNKRILDVKNKNYNTWLFYKDYINDEKPKYMNDKKKKVICLTTNEIFNTVIEAKEWCGGDINAALKGIQKTAGRHPKTKQKLKWEYVKIGDLNE